MAGYVKQRKKIPITMRRSTLTKKPQLIPVDIPFPLPGIHLEKPRDQVAPGSAIDTDAVLLRYGALVRSPGWSSLGTALDDDVVGLSLYITDDGIYEFLALSTNKLYKYGTDWAQVPKNPAGDLTGTEYDLFWMTQIGGDLLFCQGVDAVMRYSGGADFALLNANSPPAKSGIGHQGRLLLGHTFEGGTEYPHRMRWNVIDDIVDWVGAGSGYIDFSDTSDYLTCITTLSNYPVIFKEKTIIIGSRTGLSSPAYDFVARDDVNGTFAAKSVVNLGDRLAFVGKSDIFIFDLNKSTSIGEPVKSKFFDEINPAYKNQCIAYFDEVNDEVHFCTPTGNNTFNNIEWIWNKKDNTWSRRIREVKCFGTFLKTSPPTWNSSSVSWDSMQQRWRSGSLLANAQNTIFGTRTGAIFKEDPSNRGADGAAFESLYEFGDIKIDPSRFAGVSYIEVMYRDVGTACSLTLGLSNDGGSSWLNKTVALTVGTGSGKILNTRFFHTIAGRTVCLRTYVNSATTHYEIVGIRLWLTSVGK